KRHQQQDTTGRGVSRPRGHSSIEENVEATTYRPRGGHFLANRRSDNIGGAQHELFNRDITQTANQNSILQNYIPSAQHRNIQHEYLPLNQNQNQQVTHLSHNYVPFTQLRPLHGFPQNPGQPTQEQSHQYLQIFDQQPRVQQRIDQNINTNPDFHRQAVAYTPLNYQGQYQDQASFLQSKALQEGQFIQNQLNRQHNRFAFNNQNTYVPLG
ncbi:hypothetical protein WA026_007231, partial [Henosepilachna vigintioctopunctata]